jgi:hypothetical protein
MFWKKVFEIDQNRKKVHVVQANLCQKYLFIHQLTHNMTKDCSMIYKFSTRKLKEQNMSRTCCLHKLFRCHKFKVGTLYLHHQKSIKLHNFWMIMSEITWIFYLNLEIFKKKWIDVHMATFICAEYAKQSV